MIDKVVETIEKYGLFQKGDWVVAGVSGGADSVALLHCLAQKLPRYELHLAVCHLNHRLRGEESDRDEAFVRELCGRMGLPCHVLSEDVAAAAEERGIGLEECGRELRYRFFRETASHYGDGTKIATAHTLSDQAETVLFRLARGTGLRGLCGIPPVRGAIVRPLLEVTRSEVEAYCAEHGLAFVTDSSNRDRSYARNRIRLDTVPSLLTVNPSFLASFKDTVEALREDDRFLWKTAAELLGAADREDGYSTEVLSRQPEAVRRRMLMLVCRENGLSAGREKLKELDQIIQLDSGKINMSGGIVGTVAGGRLFFSKKEETPGFLPFPLGTGILTFPSGIAYNINVVPYEEFGKKVNRNFATDILDCDRILGNIIVRPRQSGDKITLLRRGITKSLKKLYNEAKVPLVERGRLAVFADGEGVVWAEGFGVSRRAAPTEQTKRCIVIRKAERN